MTDAGRTTRRRGALSRVRRALAARFGVDTRALAVFRMALGGVLLLDLLLRARNLRAFYTDAGVLPRAVLADQYPAFASVSLHALSGGAWLQVVLFAVAALAAVALAVGYRTRLATAVSLVLLVSLHARNPIVLNAGDSVLRRLLLWSVFLPLGARWSVDTAHSEGGSERRNGHSAARRRVASVASAALLVQVVLVYAVNAVLKLQGDRWLAGTAVRYVFSLEQFTVFLGETAAQYPGVLTALSHVWLAMLVASPLLVLLTGWPRAIFAGLFAGAHVGMLATMQLGVFPLVSMAALLPFLPPVVWDAVEARLPAGVHGRLAHVRDGLARMLPAFELRERSRSGRAVRTAVRRVAPAIATVLLAAVLVWSAMSVGLVGTPESVSSVADPEEHRWNMFAPEPLSVDGWVVAPGDLAGDAGERVDAFRGGPVDWEKPEDVSATYSTARWRKYLVTLWQEDDALQHAFAEHLCERWNERHERGLERVAPHFVEQETRLDGPEPTRRVQMVEHACTPPNASNS